MSNRKTSWGFFPQEIRLMILEALIQDGCILAPYATVCREWQSVIEQETFRRLEITTPSRLTDFSDMVYRQRRLVKYIWLSIELQEYDCSQCGIPETDSWHETNTSIVQNAINDLFSPLSKWELGGDLWLDIGVHSPSDSQHYIKHLQYGSGVVPEIVDEQEVTGMHDTSHNWVNGEEVFPLLPENFIGRLFEDIKFGLDFWRELPIVTAVTGLLLRRQTRRRWEPITLEELLKKLPQLQEIYHEPWREWSRIDQRLTDEGNMYLFESLIPNRLRRMVVFEDFNDLYSAVFQGIDPLLDAELIPTARTADFAVSRALAEASLSLEHLSVSFAADAKYFFQARRPAWNWDKLALLALTSPLLVPGEKNQAEINNMLQAAADAAMMMPRLESMELWNGGRGLACVFRYEVSNRQAAITWRGTWRLTLESRVFRSWETVALKCAQSELRVIEELLDAGDDFIRSHGDAIRCLNFQHPLAHPVSLLQIEKEAGICNRVTT